MKRLLARLFLGALIAGTGCNTSPPGGPGASQRTAQRTETVERRGDTTTKTETEAVRERTDKSQTFKLAGPNLATRLKQGEKSEIKVTVNRESNFNESVKLSFQAPQGLKVTPESVTVQPNEREAPFFVEANKDAPVGDQTITVTGTPEHGAATTLEIKVHVNEGGAGK